MDFEVNKVKSVIFPNTHIHWNLLFHMLCNPIVQMVWICLTLSKKCFANFQNKNHEYKVIDEFKNVTTVYKISWFFFQTCSSSLNSIWCEGNHFLILYAGKKKQQKTKNHLEILENTLLVSHHSLFSSWYIETFYVI